TYSRIYRCPLYAEEISYIYNSSGDCFYYCVSAPLWLLAILYLMDLSYGGHSPSAFNLFLVKGMDRHVWLFHFNLCCVCYIYFGRPRFNDSMAHVYLPEIWLFKCLGIDCYLFICFLFY